MSSKDLTALVSLFARAYHFENHAAHVFADTAAKKLLSHEEYEKISESFSQGASYFAKNMPAGSDALGFVVDTVLSPAPLMRSSFAESLLETSVKLGAGRYFILGAGYDTFIFREPEFAEKIEIYEADLPAISADKIARAERAGLSVPDNAHFLSIDLSSPSGIHDLSRALCSNSQAPVFISLLGLVHYLPREGFSRILSAVSKSSPKGSSIVFDYPNENFAKSPQFALARGAGQEMRALYSYYEMEKLLEENNFLIYEHISPREAETRFFSGYNSHEKVKMHAPSDTELILAVNQA